MSRPRNNLDELQRKHALPTASSPTKPATPQAGSGKAKFKPAKSIPTPATVSVQRLGSWSTPGFGKAKPPPLNFPSAADNSVSYVDVSSTESISANASTSSIPTKRLSSGYPDDLFPHPSSPKRPKTNHLPDKENLFQPDLKGKGKARAQDPPRTPATKHAPLHPPRIALPGPDIQRHPPPQVSKSPLLLRAAFDTLPADADLCEKSEDELLGVCNTAEELRRVCDKLIGAARASQEPKDGELLDFLSDFLERRAAAGRAELKAVQRGERAQPVSSRHLSVESNLPSGSSATLTDSEPYPNPLEQPALFDVPRTSTPVNHAPTTVPSVAVDDAMDADDDDLWKEFPNDFPSEPDPVPIPAPATPPATQPRERPPIRAISPDAFPSVAINSTDYTSRPYYPQVLDTLSNVFGLKSFRPKQLEAICAAMDGNDVFVLFPTGSGKSLTFQLPAVCQDGVTVVVSPLVALMRDQVQTLKKLGANVEQLSGSMKDSERNRVKALLRSREKPNLLYVTPEQLQMSGYMQATLHSLYEQGKLIRFVIDEAHCISDWGRRFRESYTQLTELRKNYPNVPISALTATANAEVEHDIVSRLDIPDCVRLKLSFNRKNLDYEVRPKNKKTCIDEIGAIIQSNYPTDTGIIYCHSRENCEVVAKALRDRFNLKAKHYHALLDERDKLKVQQEWSEGKVLIIVATIAFGMGIDKADVRYVIHYTLPATLANYYQETGRAGRDGKLAHCILFYHFSDVSSRVEMIRREDKAEEEKRWIEDDFWSVVRYCSNEVRCRRLQVLDFFGEKFDPAECRELCNNCRNKTPILSQDCTEDALKTMFALEKLVGMKFAVARGHLASFMRGTKVQAAWAKRAQNLGGYGSLKHITVPLAELIIDEMLFQGVFTTVQQKSGEFSNTYIKPFHKADELKSGSMRLTLEYRQNGRAPGSKAQRDKSRGKAAFDDAAPVDSAPAFVAGPSAAGPSRSRKTKTPVQEDGQGDMLSLFREDPDESDLKDDEIDEISSPSPPPRIGNRAMPSASRPSTIELDSDIEEVDSPVPQAQRKVTLVTHEDLSLDDFQPKGDDEIESVCKQDLFALREEIRAENQDLAAILGDEVIGYLGIMFPNTRQALQDALDDFQIDLAHLGKWEGRILDICANYNFTRTQA